MDFVFETRRKSGNPSGSSGEPDFAAVRISSYRDKNASSGVLRLRFAFTSKAVAMARWIKDDRLDVGGDTKNMMLAFKRSASGYRIVGKGFSERAKDRPSVQITVTADSHVAVIASLRMGEWIRLQESGLLLVAPVASHEK